MTRRAAVGAACSGAVLLVAAPRPGELMHGPGPSMVADPAAPVVAAAALVAWLLVIWLAAAVAVTAAGALPGATGTLCTAVARRLTPLSLRRGIEIALGLTLAAAVPTASPATAAAAPTASPATAAAAPSASPTTALAPTASPATASPATAPLTSASARAATLLVGSPGSSVKGVHGRRAPTPPDPPDAGGFEGVGGVGLDWPASPAAAPRSVDRPSGSPPPGGSEPVVVLPGSCLWDIARTQLQRERAEKPTDAQVARAWPAWWAANRELVGEDPHLLHPGMRLTPPPAG